MAKKELAQFTWGLVVLTVPACLLLAQTPSVGKGTSHGPSAGAHQKLVVVPDLDQRLARFRPDKMPFDSTGLSAREKQLVEKLIPVDIDPIFSFPEPIR